MAVLEHAPDRSREAPTPRWLMRETRIGAHLYPLRAVGLAVVVGMGSAVLAVPALLGVLGS
jgi:hypothetical protein